MGCRLPRLRRDTLILQLVTSLGSKDENPFSFAHLPRSHTQKLCQGIDDDARIFPDFHLEGPASPSRPRLGHVKRSSSIEKHLPLFMEHAHAPITLIPKPAWRAR